MFRQREEGRAGWDLSPMGVSSPVFASHRDCAAAFPILDLKRKQELVFPAGLQAGDGDLALVGGPQAPPGAAHPCPCTGPRRSRIHPRGQSQERPTESEGHVRHRPAPQAWLHGGSVTGAGGTGLGSRETENMAEISGGRTPPARLLGSEGLQGC